MISDDLFVCLILSAPLYAAFSVMLFPVARAAIVSASLLWIAAAVYVLIRADSEPASIVFGLWLGSSVESSASFLLEFRFDTFAAVGIGTVAASLLVAPLLAEFSSGRATKENNDQRSESAPRLLTLVALSGAACMATDLCVLVMLWLLLDVALASRFRVTTAVTDGSGPLKPLQVSSLLLLVALLTILARYDTSRIHDVLAAARPDDRVDAAVMRSGISVFVALAACCRIAMFPWMLWLKRVAEQARPLDLIAVPAATLIPAGVFVLRLVPLISQGEQAVILLGGLGAVTAVVTAGLVAVQRRIVAGILLAQVTVFAQAAAVVDLVPATPAGPLPFARTAVLTWLGVSLLWARRRQDARLSLWLALAFLLISVSGYFGDVIRIPEGHSGIHLFVRACLAASQLLLPIGLVRLLTRECRGSSMNVPNGVPVVTVPLVLVSVGSSLGVLSRGTFQWQWFFSLWSITGLLFGWVLFSRNARLAAKLKPPLRDLIRLCEEWWYVERAARGLVVVPLRLTSQAVEFFDRHLLGGAPEGAWQAHFRRLGGHVEHIRKLDPRYAVLATVLCLTGLLLALTGTGS